MTLTPLQAAQNQQLVGDLPTKTIPIYDEFNNSQGQLINYSAYSSSDQAAINNQAHIDIRSFNQLGITIGREMTWFDTEDVSQLDSLTMTQLETALPLQTGEAWTNGTVGKISSLNNIQGMLLSCIVGVNTTQSVITNPISNRVNRVDISTGFADTDQISIAFPNFPLASINLTQSYIDFTSTNDGSFSTGQIDTIPFDYSNLSILPSPLLLPSPSLFSGTASSFIAGNSEFAFPRSLLTNVDIAQITGVRFRITATAPCIVTMTAIRLLASTWQYPEYDLDTLWKGISPVPNRVGILGASPINIPTLWRSDVPSSSADPKPIDLSVAINFNTGSMVNANGGANRSIVNLYFRETTQDESTQSSMDLLHQTDLTGFVQPDFGQSSRTAKTQTDMQVFTQGLLEGQIQGDIETKPNSVNGSYIRTTLKFGGTKNSVIDIRNELGSGYTNSLAAPLVPNTSYIMIASIQDIQCRVQIYPLNPSGHILTNLSIFDSGWIQDSFIFKRRAGRFGWDATLLDGDVVLNNIRTRSANFGEYRTSPFESVTPVVGASLQVQGFVEKELFTGWSIGPYGGSLSLVPTNPSVHQYLQVTNNGQNPYQGIVSNQIYVENFDAIEVDFDIKFPINSLGAPLKMFLLGEQQRVIELPLNITSPDRWQHVNFHTITNEIAQTGPYAVMIVQPTTNVPTVWSIDNMSIKERNFEWSAKATKTDAWGDKPLIWTNFYNAINKPNSGVTFEEKDNFLQIRGKALKQTAYIADVKVTPKYAELGNLIWNDLPPSMNAPIAAFFINKTGGLSVTLDGSASTDLHGYIINYEWRFDDGTIDFGSIVDHTYLASGVHSIGLTVTNNSGARNTITQNVVF